MDQWVWYAALTLVAVWLSWKLRRPALSSWAPPLLGHNFPFFSDPAAFMDRFRCKFGDTFTVDIFLQTVTIFLGEANVRDVFKNDGKAIGANWPPTFQKILGSNAVTVVHGDTHKKLRKAMRITPQTLKATLEVVARLVRAHVDQWLSVGVVDDMVSKAKHLSFDIAIAVFFGGQDHSSDSLVTIFDACLAGLAALVLVDHGAFTFGKAMAARRKLVAHFDPIVDAIEAQGPEAPPSVCKDLLAIRFDDDEALSRESIIDNLITLLFAAHDTSAHTAASALYLVQRAPGGPEARDAVRAELDALWPDGSAAAWTTLPPTPVLDAFTKEVLRLGSPVTCLFKKAREPLTVAGKHAVKAGQNVGISIVTNLRDPTAFPEPLRLDYTRFTGDDPVDKRHPYSYCPFGSGIRACLGQNLAVSELRLILATLVKHTDWDLVGDDCPKADLPFVGFNPKLAFKKRTSSSSSSKKKNRYDASLESALALEVVEFGALLGGALPDGGAVRLVIQNDEVPATHIKTAQVVDGVLGVEDVLVDDESGAARLRFVADADLADGAVLSEDVEISSVLSASSVLNGRFRTYNIRFTSGGSRAFRRGSIFFRFFPSLGFRVRLRRALAFGVGVLDDHFRMAVSGGEVYSLLATFAVGSFVSGALVATALLRRPVAPSSEADDDPRERRKRVGHDGEKDSSSEEEDDEQATVRDDYGVLDAPYKMLLLVNMDLRDEHGNKTKMKPGKTAAQCCHACLGVYKLAARKAPSALRYWSLTGQAKVCVKVPTEAELLALAKTLSANGICNYIVEDAGRTQVAPGSRTVLAVGPAPVAVLDPFTNHLKLY
eukprot:CAMPEP_0198655908 /NCGR_PEP_ID=MMETSP1467-20131203/8652_1 /TAXON_ID=1462469 /ORGANISM="unid. sp., Strain CCMP2135" /LENGTH=829 /DNA_ID=CAMNT_0044391921 /DNA_START=105 /DNA_END=2596 /DNA_ORIENTATION=-